MVDLKTIVDLVSKLCMYLVLQYCSSNVELKCDSDPISNSRLYFGCTYTSIFIQREYNPERFRDSTIKLSDKSNNAF